MGALDGAVENALDSEEVGDLGIHRRRERTLPFAVGAEGLECFGFGFFVLFDFVLVFGAGRGVARRDFQQHAGIALALDSNLLFE